MESFTTVWTYEGFVVGVCAHMGVEIGGPIKRLITARAYVGLHRRVSQTMARQVARLSERPPT